MSKPQNTEGTHIFQKIIPWCTAVSVRFHMQYSLSIGMYYSSPVQQAQLFDSIL